MLKGEHTKTKSFGVVLTQDLDFFSDTEGGRGHQKYPPFKSWVGHTHLSMANSPAGES